MGWGGQGLGDMKVHKSKLQKDKDAWARAVGSAMPCFPNNWHYQCDWSAVSCTCDNMTSVCNVDLVPPYDIASSGAPTI